LVVHWVDVKFVPLYTKAPPIIFYIGLLVGKHQMGDVIGPFVFVESLSKQALIPIVRISQ